MTKDVFCCDKRCVLYLQQLPPVLGGGGGGCITWLWLHFLRAAFCTLTPGLFPCLSHSYILTSVVSWWWWFFGRGGKGEIEGGH